MANSNSSVESACASLVREYLSRKGLKGTLQKMDEEHPRTESSISNRQMLMKHVHLEKLMKKNKEEAEPLKAMLEIMTKYFMDRIPQRTGGKQSMGESDRGSQDLFSSNISFSPQINQPDDPPLMKTMVRPNTTDLKTRREKGKASNDLVVDDNVDGETIMGGGKSGLMALEVSDSTLQFPTKVNPPRPVSAKLRGGGMITSNDDALGKRRRSQPTKSSRMTVLQPDQPKKDILPEENNNQAGNFINGKGYESGSRTNNSSSSLEFTFRSLEPKSSPEPKKTAGDPPVSFEALLLKGEERSNLLSKIGLDKKDQSAADESYKVETSSMVGEKFKPKEKQRYGESPSDAKKVLDLEVGDLEDVDGGFGDIQFAATTPILQKPVKLTKIQSTPIDLKTAIALKNIVLGSPSQQYTDEWLHQSFCFCDNPDLKYGIAQKKGGPCGVLAAVQTCLLQEMLFGPNRLPDTRYKNPTRAERSKFLAYGLSSILWRAGNNIRAVVTLPSDTTHILSSSKFKQDNVTERLAVYTFTNQDELSSFLMQSVTQFEADGNPGVILTMYSAILSRKLHLVRGDPDTSEQNTLIGSHGYCTQELVNLLLTGKAVSNVFNDIVQLDSGGLGDPVILKGISGRSDIGLLSLFEHYKSCQVGTYYKTPKYPIWVVCSESHFSVLFSPRRDLVSDWKAERRFDLIYYDGLARQQEEIRLTISTINQSYKPPSSEEDLVPPLEHCIRTKWPDAEISWNGSEPIL